MENTFEQMIMPLTTIYSGVGQEACPGVYCLPLQIVNVCMVGDRDGWTLVDAGMPRSARKIIEEADDRFGAKPQAIVLTHGHFDHVGAIVELVEEWGAPVYAHELELPYLTGRADYPPGDPTVNGGLISELSPLFPNAGIDLGDQVRPLPADGRVPGLPGWRWIHTPGHTPGHASFLREADRALIAGDAFVTVKQESLFRVLLQEEELSGPPRYFTTDWDAARASVRKLRDCRPSVAVTGHGRPMSGEELTRDLGRLADRFDELAVPKQGRYVH